MNNEPSRQDEQKLTQAIHQFAEDDEQRAADAITNSPHLPTERLPMLARSQQAASPRELQHLEECSPCQKLLEQWRVTLNVTPDDTTLASETVKSADESEVKYVHPDSYPVNGPTLGRKWFAVTVATAVVCGLIAIAYIATEQQSRSIVDQNSPISFSCIASVVVQQGDNSLSDVRDLLITGPEEGFVYFIAVYDGQYELLPGRLNLAEAKERTDGGGYTADYCLYVTEVLDVDTLGKALAEIRVTRKTAVSDLTQLGKRLTSAAVAAAPVEWKEVPSEKEGR